jgi:hypothetical protein
MVELEGNHEATKRAIVPKKKRVHLKDGLTSLVDTGDKGTTQATFLAIFLDKNKIQVRNFTTVTKKK